MTDPKTKRERAIERVGLAIAIHDGCGLTIDGERVLCDHPKAIEPAECHCRAAARIAIDAYERGVMSADTTTSPLTDESTGGPEGSGPGWEP